VNVAAPSDAIELYVDVDWLGGPGAAPCLYVRGGALRASWDKLGGVPTDLVPALDAAGHVLGLLAERAAAAVSDLAGAVEVVGRGAVAQLVRDRLGQPEANAAPPAAVIECTGEAAAIEAALRRLDDLGTLVVAGASTVESLTIDLYPDIHVRSLHVVGVAVDLGDEALLDRGMLPDLLATTLCEAGDDGGGEEGCTWLRFRPAGDRRQS
jgi:hypothetical protein